MAASAKKCCFWQIVRCVLRTRSRFHPSVPKEALRQESQKDSRDDSPVTPSQAVTPLGGVSGVTLAEQTRSCHAVLLARNTCSQDT